ncbi:MAG: hypothetical protein E7031_09710 [Akkermansiaceae bacterium]|nr:hypothetical protein [Akkermansiaceae bacterium]
MNALTTEVFGAVPPEPSFIIPAIVNMQVVQELERVLGGKERVVWMVESALRPEQQIMQYLQSTQSSGFFTAIAASGAEPVIRQIERTLQAGRHVVLLCGKGEQADLVTHVPTDFLSFTDATSLAVVPVGVCMFNENMESPMVAEAPFSHLQLHFMEQEVAGVAMAARVRAAWQEAVSRALALHPAIEGVTLNETLLTAILRHSQSEIADGIDDSRMSYRRVLVYALLLSRRLRHYTSGRRLGIILPPGKLSVIANLACIFAGIAPLNVNYHASEHVFNRQRSICGIDRFIASEAFMHKQDDFAWPNTRDIIFIDKELLDIGASHLRFWELMSMWSSRNFVTSRFRLPQTKPDDEALLAFAPGGDEDEPRLICYTHRAILTAAVQVQSRVGMAGHESILYAQPLYSPEALVPQLILPLLLGMRLVTYPSPTAGVRLTTMIRQRNVSHIVLQHQYAQAIFDCAAPEHLRSVRRFLLVGGKVPLSLVRQALTAYKLPLCECRYIPEFAAPLTMVYHESVQAEEAEPEMEQGVFAGNVGALLPGFSLRLMDIAEKETSLTPDSPGIVRILGPSIIHNLLTAEDAAASCYTTSYLGYVNRAGELCIMGSVNKFSKVQGELVPHEKAEAALCALLKINPQHNDHRIALIGMPDPASGGHFLVMLSTVHKTVIPNDTVSLHYGLINMKLPPQWAPKQILSVPFIPVLPDGSVHYEYCRRGIQSVLNSARKHS